MYDFLFLTPLARVPDGPVKGIALTLEKASAFGHPTIFHWFPIETVFFVGGILEVNAVLVVIAFSVFSFEAWDSKKRSLWVHGGSLAVHAENFSAKTNRPNKEARSLPVVIVNVLFVCVCVCVCVSVLTE